MIGDLEISAVSPPGSTSYVIVNYKGQRVLAGRHTSTDIELENGNLEYSEFVEIERFIPGAWEKQVDEFYTKHFNCQ